jgi:hypothetical protein
MKKLFFVAAVSLALALTGCSTKSHLMSRIKPTEYTVPEGKAVITFFRTHQRFIQYQAPILRVSDDYKTEFVGIVSTDTKIREVVDPGEYQYVVANKGGYLLKAQVEANKAYYVRVEPEPGFGKPRFSLQVIQPDTLESTPVMLDKLRRARLVTPNARGETWYEENRVRLRNMVINSILSFNGKTKARQRLQILTPDDGTPRLY